MRPILLLFFLLSTLSFSQKQYEFDYLIASEVTYFKDTIQIKDRQFRKQDKTIKKYYLTNSKKNNYTAVITALDSLNYKMVFKDENGIYANVTFLKADLNKAEYIHIKCRYITKYHNQYKYQTKNYDFFVLSDTMINHKPYGVYKLSSIKPKKKKRKKLGTKFYIVDKETSFHLPILNFSTAYEEWKINKIVPNGIFLEKFFIDYYGNLDSKEQLINYWKIDKKIVISNDCDYAEN